MWLIQDPCFPLTLSRPVWDEMMTSWKPTPGIINGAQSRSPFPISGSPGWLIILFVKIISPSQDRSSSGLQLVHCACIFQFCKIVMCHEWKLQVPGISIRDKSSLCSQPMAANHVNLASVITEGGRGRVRVYLCVDGGQWQRPESSKVRVVIHTVLSPSQNEAF